MKHINTGIIFSDENHAYAGQINYFPLSDLDNLLARAKEAGATHFFFSAESEGNAYGGSTVNSVEIEAVKINI